MTPLAQRIANDLLQPVKDRQFRDFGGIARDVIRAKQFDVSEAMPLIEEVARKAVRERLEEARAFNDDRVFLPTHGYDAPTWLEGFSVPASPKARLGALVALRDGRLVCRIAHGAPPRLDSFVFYSTPVTFSFPANLTLSEENRVAGVSAISQPWRRDAVPRAASWEHELMERAVMDRETIENSAMWLLSRIPAALILINSPKVIGRRVFAPHRGLERRMLAQQAVVGSFPLQAWTKILLACTPRDASGEAAAEARLTGRRCLHWVRAFTRIRNGKLEIVGAHWRGDAAIGIKRSTYELRPN